MEYTPRLFRYVVVECCHASTAHLQNHSDYYDIGATIRLLVVVMRTHALERPRIWNGR